MKAIILAAGRGKRISRMIKEVPKSTLPIDGIPLIRRTVELLLQKQMEIIVCVGYQQKEVKKCLEGLNVEYRYNPFYDTTNSVASLWFAKDDLEGDILVMNADVYCCSEILDLALDSPYDVVMLTDKSRLAVGDYFFQTASNGCIVKYGKELPLSERSSEYVGIAKVMSSFTPIFKERLLKMIDKQASQKWWENVLYSFTDEQEKDIYTIDVDGRFWAEIDYFDDYDRILNYVDIIKQKEHRIYSQIINIKTNNVKDFYEARASRIEKMDSPYVAVLLGDQNPDYAIEWDKFEKEFILPQLEISDSTRVLDVGCGIGRWAEAIIPSSGYYCGCDFSGSMIEVAKNRASMLNGTSDFHELSFQQIAECGFEFFKGKFNRVIMGGVCMCINDDDLYSCYAGLEALLEKNCIIYFTETVGIKERLTLSECPSEALKATYDVIYRTADEYNKYYKIFLENGFEIYKQDFLPHLNKESQYNETDRWYTILKRNG